MIGNNFSFASGIIFSPHLVKPLLLVGVQGVLYFPLLPTDCREVAFFHYLTTLKYMLAIDIFFVCVCLVISALN